MKKPIAPFWVVPTLLFLALGTVWLRLMIVRTTYDIGEMNRQIKSLRKEKEGLQVEVAELRSPHRLEDLARKRFGLAPPRVDQLISMQSLARKNEGTPRFEVAKIFKEKSDHRQSFGSPRINQLGNQQ